ncbi:MAG: FliM/FliN family flagellar motor switch protein [Acidobacteria bacterium]|nr:FliM/FliN family flagellar motor switch protein [Acidobacteriota bacterium]
MTPTPDGADVTPEAVVAQAEQPGPEAASGRIGVILGIDLPVVVRFGRTELPIRTLTRLGPGSVIELRRSPDDPVDVLVGDRVVARGEVVIVGGNYGIRILEVISNPFRERRSARGSGPVAPSPSAPVMEA